MIKNKKVVLLENILVDRKLLKHRKIEKNTSESNFSESSGNITSSQFNSINQNVQDEHLRYLNYIRQNSPTLTIKLKIWLYKKLYYKTFNQIKHKKMTLADIKVFFNSIKTNVSKLNQKKIDNVLNKYYITLENAKHNNQTALIETLKDYAKILKLELTLSISKFNQYLTEEEIVNFHAKASVHEKFKTGLYLTYVKNFTKIIPFEITKIKKEADDLKVFDNYAILHYDPSGKAVKDTKTEKERKKDPVLFGLIEGSTKLYYIGDWIDDYCDLTLDVIIDRLGNKPNELNVKTIKNNIDKV